MSSVKDILHDTIEVLSEEEANQVLEFTQRLHRRNHVSLTLKYLASDPAFEVPPEDRRIFRVVKPIKGTGVPASKLLVEDRR